MELYIHIPFCKRKCLYCDFVSCAGKEELFDPYIDALCNEIRLASKLYNDKTIETIYIGGGTPSLLNSEQISRIIECLKNHFKISGIYSRRKGLLLNKIIRPQVEFSIECNPGTVDKEKLSVYKKLGINRLSIGLQSTDDKDLRMLGRIHNYDDFVRSFECAREAGFDNINVDLMQAIPGQDINSWKKVLAVLGSWGPEHISAYSLIIEDGTPFRKMFDEGSLPLPDEETERNIYYYTKEFLEKSGYYRYEISNYSKKGFECRHNIGYWERKEYLGLGLNSSSFVNNSRWKNTEDLKEYIEFFSSAESPDEILNFREESEILSHKDKMEEYMILGLRMTKGVSKSEFFSLFGQDFDFTYGGIVANMQSLGLMITEGDAVRLTDKGIDVSNSVLSEFLL